MSENSIMQDVEQRKNNTYFDQKGKQILVGDLLRVFHFIGPRRKRYYTYSVSVMENTPPFPVMAMRGYDSEVPNYRLYAVCDNPQRVYHGAEIIHQRDSETKRQKIKVNKIN